MTILKYWQPILAFILTALLSYGLHHIDVTRLKAKHELAVKAAVAAANAICEADKQLTTEVSNDYQNQVSNLNTQLARLKRLYNSAKCVPVTRAPSGRDATASQGKPAGQSGLSAEWIVDLAGDGEKYRQQLIACQDFITKTWATKTAP